MLSLVVLPKIAEAIFLLVMPAVLLPKFVI